MSNRITKAIKMGKYSTIFFVCICVIVNKYTPMYMNISDCRPDIIIMSLQLIFFQPFNYRLFNVWCHSDVSTRFYRFKRGDKFFFSVYLAFQSVKSVNMHKENGG